MEIPGKLSNICLQGKRGFDRKSSRWNWAMRGLKCREIDSFVSYNDSVGSRRESLVPDSTRFSTSRERGWSNDNDFLATGRSVQHSFADVRVESTGGSNGKESERAWYLLLWQPQYPDWKSVQKRL